MSSEENYHELPLGKAVNYNDQYDPDLLCAIPRNLSREKLGLNSEALPFYGADIWNAYELSWLDARGKPVVMLSEFFIPCDSEAIVESKSFKLYINSFNQTRFISQEAVQDVLKKDLSKITGAHIEVKLKTVDDELALTVPQGICLDELEIDISRYQVDASILEVTENSAPIQEQLYSHLLRSLCPVTGQPDWATILITYEGKPISHESLLRYLIGYRLHQDFHEQCVERVYCDIMRHCRPGKLCVEARYLRRGGLDINPVRSNYDNKYENVRLSRQ